MSALNDTISRLRESSSPWRRAASTSVARYVWDTADWDNSRWVVPLGSSGHPGSPHYADQTETWRRVGLIPMGYGWDRIKAGSESHQTLGPE